jgi:Kdo2-lipid IVA lauroyltransferase/acyltransferase
MSELYNHRLNFIKNFIMRRPVFHKGLLLLRHWPIWIGFAIWWLIAQLPYRLQMLMGSIFGKVIAFFGKKRIAIAKRNIELCFSKLPANEQKKLLQQHIDSLGKTFFEMGIAWFWSKKRLQKLVSYEGLEYLKQAHKNKQGVLLMTVHSTHMELTAAFLNIQHSIDGTYRKHFNPVYDFIQKIRRERFNEDTLTIERKDVRGMIKSLRKGRALWHAPDQDYGVKHSIFLPFFGVNAACLTTTTPLTQMGQAIVIPAVSVRKPDGYHLRVLPPLENFPSNDVTEDTQKIVSIIEQLIMLAPEQYLWVHRRFKNQPAGTPDLYSSDLLRQIQ